jgi:ferric-dicitrate binding protein FerR (iron transport regulator)
LGENSVLELAPVDGAKLESRLSKGVLRLRDWLRQSERYRVRTPTAVCAVRGTDFTLTLTAAGGHLAVGLGEVELRDGSGKTTTLKSGQQLSFEGEKPATGPTPVSREDYESLKLTPFRDLE